MSFDTSVYSSATTIISPLYSTLQVFNQDFLVSVLLMGPPESDTTYRLDQGFYFKAVSDRQNDFFGPFDSKSHIIGSLTLTAAYSKPVASDSSGVVTKRNDLGYVHLNA